ncbi:glycosyltransferase [Oceanospirillum sediminis]|uniref:Glycosyltransferase n=1 Tax=Oceanospirillum sediminis TaxID=2760088 RepID=A0A839IQW8_9GAMM|nr:glycosyltransferase [Oceanospirillum sediminis]MBB1487338.1 glycosyltransferase [Oceanospirillum sediminis]
MRWIVFGEDWGSHPSSTQHLFSHIARKDEVIWVNSIGLRCPRVTSHDITRATNKLKSMFERRPIAKQASLSEKQHPDVIIEPRSLPLYQSKMVRRLNQKQLRKQLLPYLSDDEPTILWISLPSAADMVGICNESFSVYYCGDDFSSLAGVDHDIISRMESELVGRCDLVLTASHELAKKFPVWKTQVLEHGVDFELFSSAQPKPELMPDDKVIGFYGQLADWVDIELLSKVADRFPDWTLMLIGAIHTNTQDLLTRPNVLWLDAMPHKQLAGYCQHWQVAMLPFHQCEQITHCNPLKLREYLASGTQVISTRFPAAEQYNSVISLADNQDEFLTLLQALLSAQPVTCKQTPAHNRKIQQALVRDESWQSRAQRVSQFIRQSMGTSHYEGEL